MTLYYKGCPKRGDGDSPGHAPSHAPVTTSKREAEQRQRFRREKIKYAEVKDELGESEDELSDLVIDDRNQSEVVL